MSSPSISVITASCRPEGLLMAAECLSKQTFTGFEWLISMPADKLAKVRLLDSRIRTFEDPPREPGDFYCLNKAWNALCAQATGKLLVFLCDWIWFDKNALELFREVYSERPAAVVSSFGHHYRKVINGRPEWLWCGESRMDYMTKRVCEESGGHCAWDGHTVPPELLELAFASIPADKFREAGGFDPAYDKVAGMSEKDLARRLAKVGCEFHLDQAIEIRNYSHTKNYELNWDTAYSKALLLFARKTSATG